MADAFEGKRIGGKWRVVRAGTNEIALSDEGRPLDGGGHENPNDARRQAAAYGGADFQKARKVGSGTGGNDSRGGVFAKINKTLAKANKR